MLLKLCFSLLLIPILTACDSDPVIVAEPEVSDSVWWQPYDEAADLAATQKLPTGRMHLALVNSKVLDKNTLWEPFQSALSAFTEERYEQLKPLVLEQNIPTIQQNVKDGQLSYEELSLFFIYRIRKYESNNTLSLNSVIALNPEVLEQARILDQLSREAIDVNSLQGMPILLKDNIGARPMATTAGAIALKENRSDDAFITTRLRESKALILGKANLSEWAYYFCDGCPVGYSAIGGQTLNPYGRMVFESGGSSSGSGASVAANFCVAAIGTETAGSILSPSSQNSVVGFKPTVGLASRSGIVPISSTLDTPGPITKSVIDNAIVLSALAGFDKADPGQAGGLFADSNATYFGMRYEQDLSTASLNGKRFGANEELLSEPLYAQAVAQIEAAGAEVIIIKADWPELPGFLNLLNADMRKDLPAYLTAHTNDPVTVSNVAEVVAYNLKDSSTRMPYGQDLLEGIIADSMDRIVVAGVAQNLTKISREHFDVQMDQHNLDAVLSINNYHAAYAALAKYPAIAVPMGYTDEGEPVGLTFIAKSHSEKKLLRYAFAFEKIMPARSMPSHYQD